MSRLLMVLIVAATILAARGADCAETRHSGVVKAVDMAAGSITIEEMGPWTGPNAGLETRTVRLTPGTHVVVLSRTPASDTTTPKGDWPGGFKESSLDVRDIRPGDFVTIVADGDGRDLSASAVSIVRTDTESASGR
jgi:hypothetical protein